MAAVVALSAWAANAWLAEPVDPGLAPSERSEPWRVNHPVVLSVQLVALILYSAAAVQFTKQAVDQRDDLLRWLGAGAALGAFARLHYSLFPSLYSDYVYSGDMLRLGSYLLFLVGAAREIEAHWRAQTAVAALDERRRLARDLHDGLAQELAFIHSQTAAMASGYAIPGMIDHVAAAAQRALDEAGRAVDPLSDTADADEPLDLALRRAAEAVARRAGAGVRVGGVRAPIVASAVREALARVTREAATNAVRHGGAGLITIRLGGDAQVVRVTISDDGDGFDPTVPPAGHGLRSMRERVEALGGTFSVSSSAGQGATVEVEVPALAP